MTNSINIDPSKLSDEELKALANAVYEDVKRAKRIYEELDAYHDTLIAEIVHRLERRQAK